MGTVVPQSKTLIRRCSALLRGNIKGTDFAISLVVLLNFSVREVKR